MMEGNTAAAHRPILLSAVDCFMALWPRGVRRSGQLEPTRRACGEAGEGSKGRKPHPAFGPGSSEGTDGGTKRLATFTVGLQPTGQAESHLWHGAGARGGRMPRPFGSIAQTGERCPCKAEAAGSKPARSTNGESPSGKAAGFESAIRRFESFLPIHAPVAQPVERRPCKSRDGGSIPSGGSNLVYTDFSGGGAWAASRAHNPKIAGFNSLPRNHSECGSAAGHLFWGQAHGNSIPLTPTNAASRFLEVSAGWRALGYGGHPSPRIPAKGPLPAESLNESERPRKRAVALASAPKGEGKRRARRVPYGSRPRERKEAGHLAGQHIAAPDELTGRCLDLVVLSCGSSLQGRMFSKFLRWRPETSLIGRNGQRQYPASGHLLRSLRPLAQRTP